MGLKISVISNQAGHAFGVALTAGEMGRSFALQPMAPMSSAGTMAAKSGTY